jgi:ADP-ribosylglycohydrolase
LSRVTILDAKYGRAAERIAASANHRSQANGALMRVSPLGIWGAFRDPEVTAHAARADARLTHPNPVCQDASAVFTVAIAAAISHGLDRQQVYRWTLNWAQRAGLEASVLEAVVAGKDGPPDDYQTQQGWVLVALQNAFFQLLHASSLEDAVVSTVQAGGDTDTSAAISGALVGAVDGRPAVPAQWQRMVLSCRPLIGQPGIKQPRPAVYWPTDALVLAERLVAMGDAG